MLNVYLVRGVFLARILEFELGDQMAASGKVCVDRNFGWGKKTKQWEVGNK
jgi:hypothetical protein